MEIITLLVRKDNFLHILKNNSVLKLVVGALLQKTFNYVAFQSFKVTLSAKIVNVC